MNCIVSFCQPAPTTHQNQKCTPGSSHFQHHARHLSLTARISLLLLAPPSYSRHHSHSSATGTSTPVFNRLGSLSLTHSTAPHLLLRPRTQR
ncbi:hypothetical protein E2C01_036164 [Portunus trituberculatus]|uniref:Uncharacterized protein n=1 Tax=Portunus trituberculatus TaxID=210409 RepID=A0A5B7F631_PORTR|nr:hypothetical protein [Portunus trituberculatus]